MKKLLFICLSIICALNAAENKIIEWNAQEYAKGNDIQYRSALHFLEKNNIEIKNKRILDVGCGTGEISAFLAQFAESVDGFDSSHNMVNWARQQHVPTHKNISFMQSRAEDWTSTKKYDLATMFFCFHWFSDKQKALNQTSESLKENGELFGTFTTSDMPQAPGLEIAKKMMPKWNIQTSPNESLGLSASDTEELKKMFINAGFDIITCELQNTDIILSDRAEIENFTRPVLMSRPFIQSMSPEKREQFFAECIDELIPVLKNNETNQLILRMFRTIIHARKR